MIQNGLVLAVMDKDYSVDIVDIHSLEMKNSKNKDSLYHSHGKVEA